ncbi:MULTISPECIES: alpha/beta fold hydrolase [unclassified Microbulbifer]|uniref:alpha/beta hydrolase n=1 Tax=unclassified Microbulbifer TaxID=2619833 RepID=UPI0027E3CD9A|nr:MULTISPECIES: alpha/beta fold hydrolase [unclassified Microbulbifer]
MRQSLLALTLTIMITGASASYLAGSALSAPAVRSIGPAPADLRAVDVEFAGVKGWFVPAGENAPCLLLMHGVRSNRRSMIERARLLRQAGYSALLFDFQAHGESSGEHITFGYRESSNARAAVSLLRSRFKCSKVGAIGQSLGGAAALLGEKPIEVDALVLESVYPTIDEAVAARLKLRLGVTVHCRASFTTAI